ncbi:MAG: histidine phosphatase family protein [Gemmatimonadales bacterium]
MTQSQIWPDVLYIVRHGESAGNVAREAALLAGEREIDLNVRDVDVPLSRLGEEQSVALGRWFAALPGDAKPNVVLTSPYLRARNTAAIVAEAAGLSDDAYSLVVDERLREKEFGILDRLTRVGIEAYHPEQAEFRRLLGKFYHRPPGGESWCDVILRLRSAVEMISREYCAERVLLVCHSVVVLCMRYLLEHMTEAEILAIDRANEIANCSVTSYGYDPDARPRGMLKLKLFNFVAPLEDAGAPVTSKPDAQVAAK